MTASTFSSMICGKGPSTITRRSAVALVHPTHQLDDFFQSKAPRITWTRTAEIVTREETSRCTKQVCHVISHVMCSSISWKMAVEWKPKRITRCTVFSNYTTTVIHTCELCETTSTGNFQGDRFPSLTLPCRIQCASNLNGRIETT